MASLFHQRCFHHASREAVACCPECQRFFCRECVTEHADRLVCATCLRRLTPGARFEGGVGRWLGRGVQAGLALALVWGFFYLTGRLLIMLPASVHEGTLWKATGLTP